MKKQTIIAALLLATTMSHGKAAPNRTETPANYLKYYIGYLEFLELKKDAVDKWEDNFTQMQFHKAVLDVGPASFDVIQKYVFK